MSKQKYTLRKFINDIHLWLGIGSGIIIFIICLTGTIMVFEEEIDGLFSKGMVVQPQSDIISLEQLKSKVAQEYKGTVTGITLPVSIDEPYLFTVKKNPKERRGEKLLVNPYTGDIQPQTKSGWNDFYMFNFKLHRWLLFDPEVGRPIVGVATIIFVILSVTGLVLWFPKKLKWKWKNFKKGFAIKTTANWKRINHDLHSTLGFYALIFILIMGLTGLCWSFEGYRDALGTVIGTPIFNREKEAIHVQDDNKKTTIDYDQAIQIAQKHLNYKGKVYISYSTKDRYYSIRKYHSESWFPDARDELTIDQYGSVVSLKKFGDKAFNEKIAAQIKPLHTGTFMGGFSKFIYFLAALIGTSLPITGVIIWVNKLKKKRKKATSIKKM